MGEELLGAVIPMMMLKKEMYEFVGFSERKNKRKKGEEIINDRRGKYFFKCKSFKVAASSLSPGN